MKCNNLVTVGWRRSDGTPIKILCGSWYGGEQFYCVACEKEWRKLYPQGWRFAPGDICKHGVYVGGCMEDHLCPLCEIGE